MTRSERPVVCVVDDDDPVRQSLTLLLENTGYSVVAFATAEETLAAGGAPEAEALIVDVRLPGMGGLELLEQLHRQGLTRPTVIVTGHADHGRRVETLSPYQIPVLSKPTNPPQLLAIIEEAIASSD